MWCTYKCGTVVLGPAWCMMEPCEACEAEGSSLTNWWVFCGRGGGGRGPGVHTVCLVWVWVMGVTLGTRGQWARCGVECCCEHDKCCIVLFKCSLYTHDTPISWDGTINSGSDGLWLTGDAQINDGQTPINHLTQNRELVRDGSEWSLQDDSTHCIGYKNQSIFINLLKHTFVSSQKSRLKWTCPACKLVRH